MFKKIFNLGKTKKINQNEEVTSNENACPNDVNFIGLCPECNASVMEVKDTWACVNSVNGDCTFMISNVKDGVKLDISFLEECRAANRFKHVQAVLESCKIHNHRTTNQRSENTNSNVDNSTGYNSQSEEKYSNDNIDNSQNHSSNYNTNYNNNNNANKYNNNGNYSDNSNYNKNNYNKKSNNFFENARVLEGAKCSCGSDVLRYGKDVKCSNSNCGFNIKAEFLGKSFNDNAMIALLNRRISYVHKFTSSAGKEFNARVLIDIDDNGNFLSKYKLVYASELNKLEEKYKKFVFSPDNKGRTDIPLQEVIDEANEYFKNNASKYNNSKNNNKNSGNDNSKSDYNDYIKKINDEEEPF